MYTGIMVCAFFAAYDNAGLSVMRRSLLYHTMVVMIVAGPCLDLMLSSWWPWELPLVQGGQSSIYAKDLPGNPALGGV